MKEVILPNRAFLFGKMTYDGIATSARRCEGEDRALDLVMTKLHLDGIEDKSLGHVDLNDYKQMMINRYEDMPGYWPVLSTETIDGSVLSELVVEKSEDQEKAAKLLAVLMHTLKGSPCTVQGEEAGVELFYRDLLELRRNHKAGKQPCAETQKAVRQLADDIGCQTQQPCGDAIDHGGTIGK